jgi:hypothetical protein
MPSAVRSSLAQPPATWFPNFGLGPIGSPISSTLFGFLIWPDLGMVFPFGLAHLIASFGPMPG